MVQFICIKTSARALLETVCEVTLPRQQERRGACDSAPGSDGDRIRGINVRGRDLGRLDRRGQGDRGIRICGDDSPRVHKKQLLTRLRVIGLKLGYLLNFGAARMKDGMTRTMHGDLRIGLCVSAPL